MNVAKKRKNLVHPESFIRKRKETTKIAISAATRFLGTKLGSSSDLLHPTKLWMKTVPTPDCDVLFTFPPHTPDAVLMWILSCLKTRLSELEVYVRHHSTTDVHGFYLTTSYENLLKGAEDLRLKKRLRSEYGGGLKEFSFEERKCFENVDDVQAFLSSQERQSIVLRLLNTLTALDGDEVGNLKFAEGEAIIPKCFAEHIISQILPLHNEKLIEDLRLKWVREFFKAQPLNSICEYFGVKIAIYFAWLGHYTWALIIPAFFGLILWLFFMGRDQVIDDVCFVVFAFLNVLWATLYLVSWRRYCAELAYRWGTLNSEDELLTEPRPLFKGIMETSPITGRLEPTYPDWKRNFFRYCVSMPIIGFCLGIVVGSMFFMLEFQEWWDKRLGDYDVPFWFSYVPKILMAIVINILDYIYQKIAIRLNNLENYRLEETYENHLIVKLILFQFLNSFLSLFYIAFYLQDMDRLREQLAALLITRQVIGNIRESLIPFICEQFNLAQMAHHKSGTRAHTAEKKKQMSETTDEQMTKDESNSDLKGACESESEASTSSCPKDDVSHKINMSQAEVESAMYKYEGTFDDYLEMFIQFGYVILFSSAFPMAAMCALLNNIVEIRSDAFKLCCIFQRPFGQRAENIGSWQDAMEAMCVIAVMVNSALIGMSGQVHRMFPDLSTAGTIILIVVLEHLTLSLKVLIHHAIPDVPYWVASEMAKIEFNQREMSKKLIRTQSGTSLVLRSSLPLVPQMNYCGRHVGCQTDNTVIDTSPAVVSRFASPGVSAKPKRKTSKFKLSDCLKRGHKKSTGQRTGINMIDSHQLHLSSLMDPMKSSDDPSERVDDENSSGDESDGSVSSVECAANEPADPFEDNQSCSSLQIDAVPSDPVASGKPKTHLKLTGKRFSSPSLKLKAAQRSSTDSDFHVSTSIPWALAGLPFMRKPQTDQDPRAEGNTVDNTQKDL